MAEDACDGPEPSLASKISWDGGIERFLRDWEVALHMGRLGGLRDVVS